MRTHYALFIPLAVLLGACGRDPAPTPPPPAAKAPNPDEVSIDSSSPKLARIRVEPVVVGPMPVDEITSPGKVEVNPNRLAHVVLPVAGRVTSVSMKLGDFVRQGQPILSVESPDVDLAVSACQQAEASLVQARASQAKAQADSDRARDLFEHNAIAQKEVLNAEALLTQAKAGVEQALASLQQAKRRLEIYGVQPGQFGQRLAVRAPISGKILEITVVPGEFRNDTSTPLVTIADLSSVWVTSDVPETSIRHILLGERISVEFAAYPGETFTGRVTMIADIVDPQTRTIEVRAEMDNRAGRLRPEMFGRIRHTEKLESLPSVPVAAVIQEDGRNAVWTRLAPGRFRRVAVSLGGRSADRVAITSGLLPGDHVVTDGVMLLRSN